jgi:uncharacterized coiled-coil protein SlyX
MDQQEWDDLLKIVENLEFKGITKEKRFEQIALVKEKKHLPLMSRGEITKSIFEKYEVKTQYLSITLRGIAEQIQNEVETNEKIKKALQQLYVSLKNEDKEWVDRQSAEIIQSIKNNDTAAAEKLIIKSISQLYSKYDRKLRLALQEQTIMGLTIALGSIVMIGGDPWIHEDELKNYLHRLMTGILLGANLF